MPLSNFTLNEKMFLQNFLVGHNFTNLGGLSIIEHTVNAPGNCAGRGGGTDPQKVWVGSPGAKQIKLYLYHFIKKGGLFYIYRPRSEGDSVIGSVRPSVRLSVRPSVRMCVYPSSPA